ncbi:CopD family protein [Colwellia sp. BRX10-3]|uniref:CopD family protein n=1 Tax=Colwellia sp. BRX10-3 TaxID=2759844 RepID=UPI0015F44B40|nr:CopD family protein [Colwellia sp. BRX10-3]MBA6391538.1 CopD family protein [Colwellia sp. BRX10-3]
MQISDWSVFLLLVKLVIYVATSAMAGCLVLRLLNRNNETVAVFNSYLKRWLLICLSAALIAAILQIPVEAASMAESGFAGMTDAFMLEIIWQSVIGDQAVVRIPAFILAIVVVVAWDKNSASVINLNFFLTLFTLITIIYSFTLTGHSAEKNLLIKSIFMFHIFAISCWVGSLWPLYKSCHFLPNAEVKRLMHQFGQLAIIIILVLLVSGVTLLLQYLNSVAELFTSNYGQLILLKLLLVSAMLLLGAWHKLTLVPQITEELHIITLKRSISIEIFIALVVLFITSIFTTFVGPSI